MSGSYWSAAQPGLKRPKRVGKYAIAILQHLQQMNGVHLTRESISVSLALDGDTVKKTLKRLRDYGLAKRLSFAKPRGGFSYELTRTGAALLKERLGGKTDLDTTLMAVQVAGNGVHRVGDGDTRRLGQPTSGEKALAEQMTRLVERYDLDRRYKIGANDLIDAFRRRHAPADVSEEDFLRSIEHVSFYISSDQSQGITKPKAWMLRQLKNGYYAEPAGYVSWEEQQAAARVADAQQRLHRIREQERQQFDLDFEIWLHERSDAERRELLKGSMFSDPNSQAARAILRESFLEQTGRRDPDLDDKDG